MAFVCWEPFQEIDSLQREMNHLFNTLTPRVEGRENEITFVPAAEVNETPDAIHLKLEAPGMAAKDLDIQVTTEAVSISGDRKSETKTEKNDVTRSEFRYGRFQRVIPLPVKVQNKVQAEYQDGILRLTLPKEDERRSIKVNLESALPL